MNKAIGLMMAAAALVVVSSTADAHSLKLECKKIMNDNVVCRTVMSDGEIARNITVQLLADEDYKVVATGKTDAEGKYSFKVPAMEYNVVAQGDKAHVSSVSSADIW